MPGIFESLIRLVFPPKCIFCGEMVSIQSRTEICSNCHARLPYFRGWLKALQENDIDECCCDKVVCVFHYTGMVKEALIKYKFFNKPSYHRVFGELLTDVVKKMTNFRKFDMIISVPLHINRRNERGYNQSQLLSRYLSKKLGIKEQSGFLSRIRDTGSQSLLPRQMRFSNVEDAFKVENVDRIRGATVLLVDDILTTGHTINECSRILKSAGAKRVVAAVVATGRKL